MKKKKRLKLKLIDRWGALDLLAAGKTIDEVAWIMRFKHPGRSLEAVRTGYFPKGSCYCLPNLEGASKSVIEKRKVQLAKADLINRRSASKTLKKLWQDPEFIEKRLAGLARWSATYRMNKRNFLEEQGIHIHDKSITGRPRTWVGNAQTPESIIILEERKQIIADVLGTLDETERELIEIIIFDDLTMPEAADMLGGTEGEIGLLFNSILEGLSQNERIAELL